MLGVGNSRSKINQGGYLPGRESGEELQVGIFFPVTFSKQSYSWLGAAARSSMEGGREELPVITCHLSQEPHGWQEVVFSCPGHVSHLRAEPKTKIKGPWGQSTSFHSSAEVLTTLCCVYPSECPLGVGAGASTEDAQSRREGGGQGLGDGKNEGSQRENLEI